jgi:hypothetical protein
VHVGEQKDYMRIEFERFNELRNDAAESSSAVLADYDLA